MRIKTLSIRNFKEIIRDPLTLIFAIILPVFLLYIFQQFEIPQEIYNINNFAPSIIIFSFSFVSLFTATLLATDRSTSLLSRLYASPIRSYEYIIAYTISLIPIVLLQSSLFFIVAILLGLSFSFNIILTILALIPISLLFIALGLFIGTLTNEKTASGIGSVVVQLVVFTSGMYFDVNMLGGAIKFISNILPFRYCIDIARSGVAGDFSSLAKEIIIVFIYIVIFYALSSFILKKKMISDNK